MATSTTPTVTRGMRLERRRTGVVREVIGFTTKPSSSAPSDGVRRARLIEPGYPDTESRTRVDQIFKSYKPVTRTTGLGW